MRLLMEGPSSPSTCSDGLLLPPTKVLVTSHIITNPRRGPFAYTARLVSAGEVSEPSWIIRY